ncbi:hypothetical protein CRYUN_Cryun02cG0024500 [Craigia yunnanensis]
MPPNQSIYQSDQGTSPFTKTCAMFGTLIIVLLSLLQLNYGNKNASPFETHRSIMMIFIVTMFVYASVAVATITVEAARFTNDSLVTVLKLICFALGVLACDLLVLILSPSFGYFLLAIWLLLLLAVVLHNLLRNREEYDKVKNFYQKCIQLFCGLLHAASQASTQSPMLTMP